VCASRSGGRSYPIRKATASPVGALTAVPRKNGKWVDAEGRGKHPPSSLPLALNLPSLLSPIDACYLRALGVERRAKLPPNS